MSDGLSLKLRQDGPIPLDVAIELAPGQTLAMVGESGAGKTTVMRSIAGLYRPLSGRIACGGEVWFDNARGIDLAPHRRSVGLVFQAYALFPHRTAAANVAEPMLHLPRSMRQAQAAELLAQVHLEGLGERFPHELSGGQQQRVALARALARDPAVLLLDEPFSAVDHPTRRALRTLLAELRSISTIPIVFVSHDVTDAVRIADQICLLRAGCTVEQGHPAQLLDRPDSKLAKWLGSET
ncbi:MAG: ATP-binding cassette domain-containing protein [Sphingomonadales bacterium]|nr:ATP-binding cassette domain-containing protein [Sphingomonadales bacterium]MBD3813788.1 ATP-binding cassette domain-containing protein [Betaproteobacteria bacterium]